MLRRAASSRSHLFSRTAVAAVLPRSNISPRPNSFPRHSSPCPSLSQAGPSMAFSTTPSRLAILPFKLHDIGEGIAEVEMLSWKVQVGQRVDHFEELCEVQSDKSTAELTSPYPGVIHAVCVEEGQTIKVGTTLCEIKTDDEGGETTETTQRSQEPQEPQPPSETTPVSSQPIAEDVPNPVDRAEEQTEEREKEAEDLSSSQVVDKPVQAVDARETNSEYSTAVSFSGEASILPSAPTTATTSHHGPVLPRQERDQLSSRKVLLSSPAVRTMAARMGIDLTHVVGTGPKGRVVKEDVEAASKQTSTVSTAPTSTVPQPSGPRGEQAELTRVAFGRTRKVMWKALGSQGDVPHFGYTHTLDLTPLLPYLKATSRASNSHSKASYLASDIPSSLSRDPEPLDANQRTTLLTFLVKAMLMAMEENPIMRARVMDKGDERWLEIRRDGVVGVAVSDPKYGLVTPSLPALPPSTSIAQITSHLLTLRSKPTAMGVPASLVISSVGGLGESTGAMPIIPPGGPVAICAVGRAKWEIEWKLRDAGMKVDPTEVEKTGMRAVLRCPVGWSGDHRVLEGAELIAFTESWKKWIEQPWRWIKVDG